jgi:nitrite reductase (NADH) small subunit
MSPEADAGWVVVARLEELDARGRAVVKVGTTEVALVTADGRLFAIQGRCPHRGGPLVRGYVEAGPAIRCPMHGWRFDLETGASDRPARATVYPVRVENGQIAIRL